jgi:hypothetical protein
VSVDTPQQESSQTQKQYTTLPLTPLPQTGRAANRIKVTLEDFKDD